MRRLLILFLTVLIPNTSLAKGIRVEIGNTVSQFEFNLESYYSLSYQKNRFLYRLNLSVPTSYSHNLNRVSLGLGLCLENNKNKLYRHGFGAEYTLLIDNNLDLSIDARIKLMSGKTDLFIGVLSFVLTNRIDILFGLGHNF